MALDQSTPVLAFFQDPPRDALAQHPDAVLTGSIIAAVVATVIGAAWAYRNRSMFWLVTFLAGATFFPLVMEPLGDWFLHVWYPTNHPHVATVFDRPMPWFAVFFYIAVFPPAIVLAYEFAKRIAPAQLLLLFGVLGAAEVGLEAYGNHMGWIIYYANPATIFDVPIYCLAQNGGIFIVAAWSAAVVLPKAHGWRWVLVPFQLTILTGGFVLAATWPAYLALSLDASDTVTWVAAIISTVLNAAFVVWCAYSPPLNRLRAQAAQNTNQPAATHAGPGRMQTSNAT